MQLNDMPLERFGLEPSSEAPAMNMVEKIIRDGDGYKKVQVPAGIDPGFAYNVGERGLLLPDRS